MVVAQCQICFNDLTENSINSPYLGTGNCNHRVCQECLCGYFKHALKDDRYTSYDSIECPSSGCKEKYCCHEAVQNIFSATEVAEWWDTAIGSKAYIHNKAYYCNCIIQC